MDPGIQYRGPEIAETIRDVFGPAFSVCSTIRTSIGFVWLRFFSRPHVGYPSQLPFPEAVMTSLAHRQLGSFCRMAHDGRLKGCVRARSRVRNEANRQARGHRSDAGAAMQNEANWL